MQKSELLDLLLEENKQWQALLDQIGPTRMEQPGVNGDWSMKDLVAHLSVWNRWLVVRLEAALRHSSEPSPPWPAHLQQEDEINAWIYETNRNRSVGEILDESQRTLQELFTAIGHLPDKTRIELIEPRYYLLWAGDQRFEAGEFFDHFHDDHEPDVRAWLARVEKEGCSPL